MTTPSNKPLIPSTPLSASSPPSSNSRSRTSAALLSRHPERVPHPSFAWVGEDCHSDPELAEGEESPHLPGAPYLDSEMWD